MMCVDILIILMDVTIKTKGDIVSIILYVVIDVKLCGPVRFGFLEDVLLMLLNVIFGSSLIQKLRC